MRSKLIFAIGFGGLLAAALLFSWNKESRVTETVDIAKHSPEEFVATNLVSSPQTTVPVEPVTPSVAGDKSVLSPDSVDEQIIALFELGASNDADSLKKVTPSLSDSNPEIREAALEATLQFGSRDAIPILEELATKTEDRWEKIEILEAAKFLALPTFSEIRAQRRTNLNSKAISTSRN